VQVISSPGNEASFNPIHYGLLLVALLVIGIVYKLVTDPKNSNESPPDKSL
jgi:hypothetical protein